MCVYACIQSNVMQSMWETFFGFIYINLFIPLLLLLLWCVFFFSFDLHRRSICVYCAYVWHTIICYAFICLLDFSSSALIKMQSTRKWLIYSIATGKRYPLCIQKKFIQTWSLHPPRKKLNIKQYDS